MQTSNLAMRNQFAAIVRNLHTIEGVAASEGASLYPGPFQKGTNDVGRRCSSASADVGHNLQFTKVLLVPILRQRGV